MGGTQGRKLRVARWWGCYVTGLASAFLLLGLPFSQTETVALPPGTTKQHAQQPENNSSEIQNAAAEQIFEEGKQLYEQGTEASMQQALLKFQEALERFESAGDRQGIGKTLGYLGFIYSDLGEHRQAIEYLNQALDLFRILGKRSNEINALVIIGFSYFELGEFEPAISYYQQSLPLIQETGDKTKEAHVLAAMGWVYQNLGEREQALAEFERAVALYRQENDLSSAARNLNTMGVIYYQLGDYPNAVEYLERALPLWQETGDAFREADTLKLMGGYLSRLGNYQQAINVFERGLNLFQSLGDRAKVAEMLWRLGNLYRYLGDAPSSLVYLERALSLQDDLDDPSGRATLLSEIGLTYYILDDFEQALSYYDRALSLWRQLNNRVEEASLLDTVASIYYWRSLFNGTGDYQQGLDALQQALSIFQSEGIQYQEADILGKLAVYHGILGNNQQALDYIDRAIALSQTLDSPERQALVLGRIAHAYSALDQPRPALALYERALEIERRLGDKSSEASTLASIAELERDLGNFTTARQNIEQALESIETLRLQIASPDLRTSYFATVEGYYRFYIDLLMQLHQQDPARGYDALALHASERGKARSLLELLTEANADIRQGVDPQLLERERNLQLQLDALEQRRVEVYGSGDADERTASLEREREAVLSQYREVQAQIRARSPKYAALTQPQPLTLEQIQQQILDDETLLLQYSLGEDRSYLWLVSSDGIRSYELPPRQAIEAAARGFYQLLRNPRYNYKLRPSLLRLLPAESAAAVPQLSQMLLEPVADQLGNKRLLVVSDGALQYIPFAALPLPGTEDSEQPILLMRDREIVHLPSTSTLGILRRDLQGRPRAPKQLAILADPVFSANDRRIQRDRAPERPLNPNRQVLERSLRDSDVDLSRLPGTRQEAEAIMALVPDSQRIQFFDFAANRAEAIDEQLSQYRIVHLATHGILNSVNPELSGIVLSLVDERGHPQNGFLRLHDIFNLNLPAELVVLSACQTGLGQNVRGEGLVGLTRGFMYAGAPRVLVSLWSVDDAATAELMARFYRAMLKEGKSPTVALRQAQLEMQTETEWKNPFYWAAFIVQGEWR